MSNKPVSTALMIGIAAVSGAAGVYLLGQETRSGLSAGILLAAGFSAA